MTPTRTAFLILLLIVMTFGCCIFMAAMFGFEKQNKRLKEDNEYLSQMCYKLAEIDIKQDSAICNCYNYPNHDSLTKAIVKRLNKQKRSF